mmetsp:Transcript_29228/g.82474  ORF Transcript_29228/g.82474 Transcript_29228/m.82474 type:complete len:369 (+) Transcript_29228:207-1313(+)|eukprot:CAMPEP_0117673804 /NCGR_PEP_ID=MMETSP0804-20121206/14678_1 /TAXON_ID=1074897 /ORGANISM="Tetraselmis astigmatica, Strain CCMP880" /LENGTH=368 /DNA_ID=CAMNT_0005482587 /DNA_START=128 /DNA_END=1234 /DNA_ORIENTATION=-
MASRPGLPGPSARIQAVCLSLLLLLLPHPADASSFRDRYKLSYHVSGRVAATSKTSPSDHLPGFQGISSSLPWFQPQEHCESRREQQEVMPAGRWLVITKRRSGSRWLVDTMAERTAGNVPYTKELYCSKCSCHAVDEAVGPPMVGGPEDKACACHLADEYRAAAQKDGNATIQSEHHYGFKFMMPLGSAGTLSSGAFGVLARTICNLNIPIIFMWRRNVLRRIISSASNAATAKAGMHNPHPTSKKEVQALQSIKPKMKARDLKKAIEGEVTTQHNIEKAFSALSDSCGAARNARVYYYEDLIDSAEGAPEKWQGMFSVLGLGAVRKWVKTDLTIIHGEQPVLSTVANPDEVKKALKGTDHEWMLYA